MIPNDSKEVANSKDPSTWHPYRDWVLSQAEERIAGRHWESATYLQDLVSRFGKQEEFRYGIEISICQKLLSRFYALRKPLRIFTQYLGITGELDGFISAFSNTTLRVESAFYRQSDSTYVDSVCDDLNETEFFENIRELSILLSIIPEVLIEKVDKLLSIEDLKDLATSNKFLLSLSTSKQSLRRHFLSIFKIGEDSRWAIYYSSLAAITDSAVKNYEGQGVDLEDLIQEGALQLLLRCSSSENFDYRIPRKFYTQNTPHIYGAIQRAVDYQRGIIRYPVHTWEQIRKVQRTYKKLSLEGDNNPSIKKIANEARLKIDQVKNILTLINQNILYPPLSMGAREFVRYKDETYDSRDYDSPSTQYWAEYHLLMESVIDVLDTLNDREARVLELRFGLEDGAQRTLEEVGQELGVTRERIRQIEAKALRKLRHPNRSKKLRDFLED